MYGGMLLLDHSLLVVTVCSETCDACSIDDCRTCFVIHIVMFQKSYYSYVASFLLCTLSFTDAKISWHIYR